MNGYIVITDPDAEVHEKNQQQMLDPQKPNFFLQKRLNLSYKNLNIQNLNNKITFIKYELFLPQGVDILNQGLILDEEAIANEGSFNKVFKAKDKDGKLYAVRVTLGSLDKNVNGYNNPYGVKDAYNEAVLTLKMAELNITPKVHDIFFAKTIDKKIKLFVVSDFANRGTVTNFLLSDSFGNMNQEEIEKMVVDIVDLYRKMIEKEVFCIDIKFDNMLVDETDGQNKITVIDFDTGYCGNSKLMKSFILRKYNDESFKELLLCINILQLCVPVECLINKNNNNIKLFYKCLVQKISIKNLNEIISHREDIQVGTKKYNILHVLINYTMWYFQWYSQKLFKTTWKNGYKDHRMIYAMYLLAYHGHDTFYNKCIEIRKNITNGIQTTFTEENDRILYGKIFDINFHTL